DYLLRRSLHLRHTLPHIMRAMGLEPAGRVPGASHVLVLRRTAARLDLPAARRAEHLSQWLGPWLNRCERPWGWVSRASRRAVGLARPTRPVRGRQTPDK
ncbi:MAG: hypothetical protein Q7J25_08175, partial [Vicinamibacterales bacterium]|nr:hypothetical protein [Vicinamibacterales bacterium]